MAQIYTIPAYRPFADDLARGMMQLAAAAPQEDTAPDIAVELARMQVLLPNSRAVKNLREAFLRQSGGMPMLLPRLMPLGHPDEVELLLRGHGLDATQAKDGQPASFLDIPEAIAPLQRRLILTRLIRAQRPELTPAQGSHLAESLAHFLDQVQAEDLDFAALRDLPPAEYARHWQQVLVFLTLLTENWPLILQERGQIDPMERRNRLLRLQAHIWQCNPPADYVVAAAGQGGGPAAEDLVHAIAQLPRGIVVLPGLDMMADARTWQSIGPDHPQYTLKKLLDRLQITRDDVQEWPYSAAQGAAPAARARMAMINEAMRPPETTDQWITGQVDPIGVQGVVRLDCRDQRQEADSIALILKQALETPGRTAALITLDRTLARRVAGSLMRWGIAVDDTAGIPLNRTPVGIFLRHIMQVVAENFAPVPLLALLKHPLCRCGYTARQINALARVLDKYVLRGMQPYNGLLGYHTAIENAGAKMYGPRLDADQAAALHALIDAVQQAFQPLLDVFDPSMLLSVAGEQPPVALDVCVAAHVQVAELLADTVDDQTGAAIPGSTRLWVKDAGETAANFVADVLDAAPDMNAIAAVYYAPFFETLLKGYTVRPRFGLHPRVHILGPMEGRFLRPDVLVLGGVNEGVWPAYPSVDPWMSRPMRRDFGLPMPEWHIGQSAHDFVQAFCAPQVFITRAEKIANTPTVPSRWLLRLDAVLSGAGIAWPQSDHAHWAGVWDYPAEVVPMAAPEPRPPAHVRPRRYSATAVETLITDPYSIYASKILRLQPLEPLDEAPTRTYYGNLVHAVFEQFFKEHPKELPDNAAALCHSIAAQVFAPHMERPVVWAMWWPRMQRSITHFFITEEQLRSEQGRWVFTEQSGEWQLPGTDIRLSARSDRIDVLNDGTAHIIDYKTGTPPSMKSVRSCEAAQLPIAAILLEEGAFSAIPVRTVSRLSYWHIVPKSDSKKALSTNIQAEAVPATIRDSRENLRALLVGFADAATPYLCEPHAGKTLRYNKYTHLARVQEWAICGEDE